MSKQDVRSGDGEEDEASLQAPPHHQGFYFQCSDQNEIVTVSPEQAIKMQRACEYFSKVFGHGTVEADTRTIEKKDWTSKTVRHLVQLITTGSAGVKGLEELRDLAVAADQVLYKYQLQSPLQSGKHLTADDTQRFLELVPEKFVFSVALCVESDDLIVNWEAWNQLWYQKEILLLASEWETYILAHRSNHSAEMENVSPYFSYPLEDAQEFNAYCTDPTKALLVLKDSWFVTEKRNARNAAEESFYLEIPDLELAEQTNICSGEVARETGGRSFHEVGLVGVENPRWRLFGSFDLLYKGLKAVQRHLKDNKVCLKVATSNPGTIARLVNACLLCRDHQGIIGIGWQQGNFLFVKTIHDMNIILEYLASDSANISNRIVQDKKLQVKFVDGGEFEVF